MIVGVGVDAVPVARMRRALDRTPRIAERVFTAQELETASARGSREASLAARFAAKEACRKALGATVAWRNVEVTVGPSRKPGLVVRGFERLRFFVSLSHTDEVAIAIVLAEAGE